MPINHLVKESEDYKYIFSCKRCGKLFYQYEEEENCSQCEDKIKAQKSLEETIESLK